MKKIKILISVIFIFCFCQTQILGVSNSNIKIKSNKDSIGGNEELFITIYSTSNLKEEIKKIECILDYDNNVFNEISKNDISIYNIGKSVDYNEEDNTLIIGNINSENILRIRLTTKQNVKNTTANILLKEVRVLTNNGYENIKTVSSKIKINSTRTSIVTDKSITNLDITSVSNELLNEDVEIIEQLNEFMSFDSLKNLDVVSILLNPLKLFWVFIKAIIIVMIINVLAKFICKTCFDYTDILKRRRKSRKLTKVLNDLYE